MADRDSKHPAEEVVRIETESLDKDGSQRFRYSVLEVFSDISGKVAAIAECRRMPLSVVGKVVSEVPPGRHAVVLVVDDEEPIRSSWRRALRKAIDSGVDLEFFTAGNVDDAITCALNLQNLDVVVLDHMLEGGTGVEVAAHIRLKWPHVLIVVSSGYISGTQEEIRQGEIGKQYVRLGGPFDFYPKDIPLAPVLRAIRTPPRGMPPTRT